MDMGGAVKDACRLAEELKVKNLILYHTEDGDPENRKRLYTEEGLRYYSGNLLVPEDLETVMLD
jgi:ribonuclease Z